LTPSAPSVGEVRSVDPSDRVARQIDGRLMAARTESAMYPTQSNLCVVDRRGDLGQLFWCQYYDSAALQQNPFLPLPYAQLLVCALS
jgi:hypothetical protein